jgi:tetratricopeptide (TPR) repeat protein
MRPALEFSEELAESSGPGILIEGVPELSRDQLRGGISAMTALFVYWKTPVLPRESENRLAAGTSSLLIPPEEVMTDLSDRRMLWSYAFYATMQELESRLASGIPVLVMVQDKSDDVETRRYMIVVGFIQSAEKLLVHEGKSKPTIYTYGDFKHLWRPVRNWSLIVCPPSRINWEMNPRERLARARFNERTQQWIEAIRDLNILQAEEPGNINIMLAKARIHQKNHDDEEAERQYRLALSIDPLSARAANNLAYMLSVNQTNLVEAERWSRRSLTIEPSNPAYLDTLGTILLAQHRPADAAAVLERAVHRSENLPPASRREIQLRLMRAFIESDQPHLARQIWSDIQRQDPRYQLPADMQDDLR